MTSFGIDDADVDENKYDWATAKRDIPLRFAALRSDWGTYTDSLFKSQRASCETLAIPWMAYLFLRFPIIGQPPPPEPEDQARAMIATVGPINKRRGFPPVIDLETERSQTGLSPEETLAWFLRAYVVVQHYYGVKPLVYLSARWWSQNLGNMPCPELFDAALWCVGWVTAPKQPAILSQSYQFPAPAVPPPLGDSSYWLLQQTQGDATNVPGFSHQVDVDRFHLLSMGAQGDIVKWVQRRLGNIKVDGDWGKETNGALLSFQTGYGLYADGVLGPATACPLAWANPSP